MENVSFTNVLEYLEDRGWVLKRIWKPYRVFVRGNDELPIMVRVEDGQVETDDFEYIKKIAG